MREQNENKTSFNTQKKTNRKNHLRLGWLIIGMGIFWGQPAAMLHPQPFAIASPTPETINNNSPVIRTNSQPVRIPGPKVLPTQKDYETHLGKPETSNIRLVLRLGERRVYVFDGEQEIASYPVAIGKPGWETPAGSFEVIQTIKNPQWQNPWTGEITPAGPDTALGLRWIGFWTDGENAIGFHGTPTIESIGQAASHGCVRMHNEDVVALYEKVQIGTPVTVEP